MCAFRAEAATESNASDRTPPPSFDRSLASNLLKEAHTESQSKPVGEFHRTQRVQTAETIANAVSPASISKDGVKFGATQYSDDVDRLLAKPNSDRTDGTQPKQDLNNNGIADDKEHKASSFDLLGAASENETNKAHSHPDKHRDGWDPPPVNAVDAQRQTSRDSHDPSVVLDNEHWNMMPNVAGQKTIDSAIANVQQKVRDAIGKPETGDLAVTGLEATLLAGLIAIASVKRNRAEDSLPKSDSNASPEASIAGKSTRAGQDQQASDKVTGTAPAAKLEATQRPNWTVKPEDTLENLASRLYHSPDYAPLIAQVNAGSLKQQDIDGISMVTLTAGQKIQIPTLSDLAEFDKVLQSGNTPPRVLSVMSGKPDTQQVNSALSLAMGINLNPVSTLTGIPKLQPAT